MVFELAINMVNAAFEDPNELARILTELAKRLENWDPDNQVYRVWDLNGNSVGHFRIQSFEESIK